MSFAEDTLAADADLHAMVTERASPRAAAVSVDAPAGRRRYAWRGAKTVVVLASLLFVANTVLAVIVVRGLRSSYAQVQITQDALTGLYRLDADIRQIARAHREFLLSGMPQFVDQYHQARQRAAEAAAQVRALTRRAETSSAEWMR